MGENDPGSVDTVRLYLLVLRCQAGDERAFRELFDRFGRRTLGYLNGLVGDAAEDVHQEVWLAVYRGIGTLSNPRAFRTWLFRTTRHRAVDHLRRQRREHELIADAAAELPESTGPADESGDAALDVDALAPALAALPPTQREVLLLRHQHGMTYAEIALVVGCSIGTVRSRLHHARRRLHDLVERHP